MSNKKSEDILASLHLYLLSHFAFEWMGPTIHCDGILDKRMCNITYDKLTGNITVWGNTPNDIPIIQTPGEWLSYMYTTHCFTNYSILNESDKALLRIRFKDHLKNLA